MIDVETTWAQDLAAGCLTLAVGAAAIAIGRTYDVGSLGDMGPGFFPVALGVILAGLGAVLAIGALKRRPAAGGASVALAQAPDWRGWGFIVAGILSFLLLGRTAGMGPAAFCCVFLSALGDRTTGVKRAAVLAACVTALGIVLFALILKVQLPVLAWRGS